MTAKEYIIKTCKEAVDKAQLDLIMAMTCNHEFVRYGLGYKCKKCDRYTGLNSALNRLIEQEDCDIAIVPGSSFNEERISG